ncbi:hypothetical protein C7972_10567 [Arenibacter sp. ARW7G5Y1]|nr:hypothetical protein C7972_10567 [Arenibacter sp. ARW7G5Y1]
MYYLSSGGHAQSVTTSASQTRRDNNALGFASRARPATPSAWYTKNI